MSTAAIERTVRASVNEGRGTGRATTVVLAYDLADPFAVTVTVPGEEAGTSATWSAPRTLLWTALQRPAFLHTEAGVTARTYGGPQYTIVVCFFDEGARTTVWLHRDDVARLLEASFCVCPVGTEPIDEQHADLDAELAEILGSAS